MGINIGLIIILLISNLELEARPISYSGGSTLMAFSDNMRDSVYFHYSPSYKYSIGIESISDKFFDDKYSYMRFTYLLNRKNTQDSQRNLYFQSGFGTNGLDKHFIGVHGDWETRRIFAGFGFKRILNKKEDIFYQSLERQNFAIVLLLGTPLSTCQLIRSCGIMD